MESEFTLNSPLTEEDLDKIYDVDMDNTNKVTFHTKHGKEVEFVKERHGRWVFGQTMHHGWMKCSECCVSQTPTGTFSYCPNCGARMDGEQNAAD